MKGLISLSMQGRVHAIVATVLTAALALIVTPMAIVSAALIVLATLRNGAREGFLVVVSATLALAGIGGLLFGMPLALALLGLLLWLPVWGLAVVLGQSGSLARPLELAALGGAVLVVAQYALLGDPANYWYELLHKALAEGLDPSVIAPEDQETLFRTMAGWMAGGIAASWLVSQALAILLGRWAQAVLDKPGAFGREFRALQFSRAWLIAMPMLLAATFLLYKGEPSAVGQFYLLGTVLFLLQGIGLVHALIHATGASKLLLVGFYFVLLIGAPYSVTAIAAGGYADGWLNIRGKVGARPDDSGGSD